MNFIYNYKYKAIASKDKVIKIDPSKINNRITHEKLKKLILVIIMAGNCDSYVHSITEDVKYISIKDKYINNLK
jgi:hypothetical protein